jgi:hypothetical protein
MDANYLDIFPNQHEWIYGKFSPLLVLQIEVKPFPRWCTEVDLSTPQRLDLPEEGST